MKISTSDRKKFRVRNKLKKFSGLNRFRLSGSTDKNRGKKNKTMAAKAQKNNPHKNNNLKKANLRKKHRLKNKKNNKKSVKNY